MFVGLLRCTPEAPPAVAPTIVVPSAAPASTPPDSDGAPAPAAPAPRARRPADCEEALPPLDLLRDNIATTEISGLAEILESKKTALDGTSPPPTTGLVSLRYTVRVLRWFAGSGPEQLVLTQGAEAEFEPAAPGRLLFFSACVSPAGSAWSPDVGYFFTLHPECGPDAEKRAEAAAKGAGAVKKRKARACEPPKN